MPIRPFPDIPSLKSEVKPVGTACWNLCVCQAELPSFRLSCRRVFFFLIIVSKLSLIIYNKLPVCFKTPAENIVSHNMDGFSAGYLWKQIHNLQRDYLILCTHKRKVSEVKCQRRGKFQFIWCRDLCGVIDSLNNILLENWVCILNLPVLFGFCLINTVHTCIPVTVDSLFFHP